MQGSAARVGRARLSHGVTAAVRRTVANATEPTVARPAGTQAGLVPGQVRQVVGIGGT